MIVILTPVEIISAFIGCIPIYVRVFLLIYIGAIGFMFFVKRKYDLVNKEVLKDIRDSLSKEQSKPTIRKEVVLALKKVTTVYIYTNALTHRFGFLCSVLIIIHGFVSDFDLLILFAGCIVCVAVVYMFTYFAEHRLAKGRIYEC